MKDLVPKGTGNSRFLRSSIPANITHQKLVELLRSGTFPVDFAGLNSAGVAVVGSAYNKANVLPDDVCSSLGIPTTAEPKDAFNKLSNLYKQYKLLDKITSSKSWTCPSGVLMITAILVGGGGGGGGGWYDNGGQEGKGGQGGQGVLLRDIPVIPGKKYQITIGAGGAGGGVKTPGSPGGDTIAFDHTAIGGGGGWAYNRDVTKPNAGSTSGKYGGDLSIEWSLSSEIQPPSSYVSKIYTDLFGEEWYCVGGAEGGSGLNPPNAGKGGTSSSMNGSAAPSGFGGGGGGGEYDYNDETAGSGGKGGSGAVLIYVRGD